MSDSPDVFFQDKLIPVVRLEVKNSGRGWQEVNCQIDTGYWGGLALPGKLQRQLQKVSLGLQRFTLADGSPKYLELFSVQIRFREKVRLIPAVFVEQKEGLVGLEFLKDKQVVLDWRNSQINIL